MNANLNGSRVEKRGKSTLMVAIPEGLWRPIEGGCSCLFCSADGSPQPAFWDTLAVPSNPDELKRSANAWTVHAPELHGRKRLR